MKKNRIITEDQSKRYAKKRKEYNDGKSIVQISNSTHKLLKEYCKENNISMTNYLDQLICENLR